MGRLRMLGYGAALYVAFFLVSDGVGLVAGMTQSRNATVVVGIGAFAFYLLDATLILIQRSHDLNLSGWWSIAAMIRWSAWSGCSRAAHRARIAGPAAAAERL